MKAKFSLKKIKFKELFLQHVEKAVLAVTGVCLLLFIVSALRRETLPEEKQPDRLALQTQNAKAHVEKGTFNPIDVRPADKGDYVPRVRRDPVLLATYDTTVPLNGPIVSSRNKRGEPAYLSVTDLRIASGFSPFATRDPNAVAAAPIRNRTRPNQVEQPEEQDIMMGERRRGGVKMAKDDIPVIKYWTVVTGLIPVRDQKKAHFSTFEEAVGFEPEQDLPRYLGYLMERAEVTSRDLKNLKWVPIKADTEFMDVWTEFAPETVMPEYLTTVFAQPLGPRVWNDWGDESGHTPEIPFEPKRGAGGQFQGMRGGPMGPGGGEFDGEFQGGGPVGAGGFVGEGEEEEEGSEFDAGMKKKRRVQGEDPEMVRRRSEQLATIGEKPVKGVDHLLFRFCDYTVKPGKQYVYRVRLGFGNPNFGIPVKNLQKVELGAGKTRMSDWSEPSPVATIPFGDKMLAGAVIPPPTAVSEPKGTVRIVQVKEELGAEAPLEKEIYRGALLNFVDQAFMFPNPAKGIFDEATGDFVTNAVVLDLRGGKPVFGPRDKGFTEPGEILVMSRTGELLAMNEFDDEDVWKEYIPPEDPRKAAAEIYGEEGDGMPPGMDGLPPRGTRPPGGTRPTKTGRPQPGQQFDPLNGPVSSPASPKRPRKAN